MTVRMQGVAMMRIPVTVTMAAALVLGASINARAQESLGSAAPEPQSRAGWTFTPGFAFSEVYDDNITLFGRGTADQQNDDYISTFRPYGALSYFGRHTRVTGGYGGSFLNYQTFSIFNRWDQAGQVDFRRVENARLDWFAHASGAMRPSTDMVEFNGIPFSHTGAKVFEARTGLGLKLSTRDGITTSVQHQRVSFDRPGELRPFLQGGQATASVTAYRHRLNTRTAVGADYIYRRASVADFIERSDTQTAQLSLDRQLSDYWSFSGGIGAVRLAATPVSGAELSPAYRASVDHTAQHRTFHAGYSRTLLPSFGYGGTVRSQEVGVSYYTPLFHSRRFYTDHSVVFRDNVPAVLLPGRLKLRSLRTSSSFGWAPQPWVRVEAFYTRVTQSSLVAGGRLDRNRVGFQIVTSKPVRMQ